MLAGALPSVLRRASVIVLAGCAVLAAEALPSSAGTPPVTVTLSPTFGPVGTHLAITAASGLQPVTDVAFGSSAPVAVTPASDTEIDVNVPAGAASGVLTFTYNNNSSTTATTDKSFTVQIPTTSTIQISRSLVVFPQNATVSATLTAGNVPAQGVRARLQRRITGTSVWHSAQQPMQTSSQGRVQWAVHPGSTSSYRVVFSEVPKYLGSTTKAARLGVSPQVRLWSSHLLPVYTTSQMTGRVRPAPAANSPVYLQRLQSGSWHGVATAHTKKNGTFAFQITPQSTGGYAYRARRPHDGLHHEGLSGATHIRVVQRTVKSGMSGPDVLALQKRLRKLHYDVGAVNGKFGYDTMQAVVAFQKINEMSRDGVVGMKVWKALNHPVVPHLKHRADDATAGIEVDIKHQVVLYAIHGKVWRIFDASTGGGYYYTGSDGTTQKAVTPTGHFSILYKREGWVTSKLGTMWRPAYFNNEGDAIHGETDVPPYPASHGCVRITVPARDRLNNRLYDGLSVWIY